MPTVKGTVLSSEHRQRIAESMRGHAVSAETRKKIADTRRRQDNAAWKGDEAGYVAKHLWLYRNRAKTGTCDECGTQRRTEWANVSGEYRHNPADFVELCVPCHRRRDIARRTHLAMKG